MVQRIVMIVLILVVILGGGFYAYNQLMPAESEEAAGPVYSTKEVTRGDISVGVEVNGTLEASRSNGVRVPGERRYYSWGSTEYKIDEILVEEGDSVKKDQVIVTLDASNITSKVKEKEEELRAEVEQLANMASVKPEEVYDLNPAEGITLKAPIDGTIIDIRAKEAEEIELGHVIGRIVDDSKFRVKARLTINEFNRVKIGDEVALRFNNFDEFYTGKISKINPNPIPNNEKSEDGEYAQGFVHIAEIVADNPGLVQNGMEVSIGMKNESGFVNFFSNKGLVEGFVDEKKVSNTAKAVVTEIHVDEMENVKKGDPIVTMASKNIQDIIEEKLYKIKRFKEEIKELEEGLQNLEVRAPSNGIIAWMDIQDDQTVQPRDYICDLFNVDSMEIFTQVDDIDILNVKMDSPVRVTFDALPGEVFKGKVIDIRTSSSRGGGGTGVTKYPIRINVEGSADLKPGMQAKGYIDAGSAEGVLLVPMEAVFDEEGRTMVEILDENGNPKAVPIKLGLMNARLAEVKEGLEEGDKVITGSTADLLPSQRLGDKDSILPAKDESNDNGEGN
ncbi:efflux RND transporter periplasmic adaptor subunit [Maledivibacter halophilus]|uniref:RND family efflux transporter, MFP subunit n=1 Tax=Maledivibacter halophilus TaxID=36842 RepID=A0A1T5IQE6_9FIRM|nr:efflux RND transporter periplasmic adaptor subunit [Maledivibacter halophilus]SKC41404.1 RND family efflux transporter, MFP subunit [Maledivibacter halophilus]